MGAEAETLILCKVAMEKPRESLDLISQCLREICDLRPGELINHKFGRSTILVTINGQVLHLVFIDS